VLKEDVLLTASVSISAADSNLFKQCPDILQTKSSLAGSITVSLHVSSQTERKDDDEGNLIRKDIPARHI